MELFYLVGGSLLFIKGFKEVIRIFVALCIFFFDVGKVFIDKPYFLILNFIIPCIILYYINRKRDIKTAIIDYIRFIIETVAFTLVGIFCFTVGLIILWIISFHTVDFPFIINIISYIPILRELVFLTFIYKLETFLIIIFLVELWYLKDKYKKLLKK